MKAIQVIPMSEIYEITKDGIREMKPEDINLHQNGFLSYKDDTIEISEQYDTEEVDLMDNQTKMYIDQRIDNLEKSLDQKFEYQQSLFSEKIDHLSTKNEKLIGEKFTEFRETTEKNRKDDRKFYIGTAIAVASLIVGVLKFIL